MGESFCKECENRVVLGGRARPEPLANPISRSPKVHALLDDEVILAATQLDWKLSDYGLRQRDITGDGACQFRAIADQLYRDQELHPLVRERAIKQLRSNPHIYAGFVVD